MKIKHYRLEVIQFSGYYKKFSLRFNTETIYCFEYKILSLNRIRIKTLFSLN